MESLESTTKKSDQSIKEYMDKYGISFGDDKNSRVEESEKTDKDKEIERYMKMYGINLDNANISETNSNIIESPPIEANMTKKSFDLTRFMDTYPIISGMMSKNQVYGVIYYLKALIDSGVEGDIVEIGCNIGTTSIFIQKFLEIYESDRKLYCFDSPNGLPELHDRDKNETGNSLNPGDLKFGEEQFVQVFNKFGLSLPIYKFCGFDKIDDCMLPSKIALCFFDGVFYTNVMTSFEKTFEKMPNGGIIIVDDVGSHTHTSLDIHPYPGAERAIVDFFENRKESYTYDAYPNEDIVFDNIPRGGAKVVKL